MPFIFKENAREIFKQISRAIADKMGGFMGEISWQIVWGNHDKVSSVFLKEFSEEFPGNSLERAAWCMPIELTGWFAGGIVK